MSEREGKQSFRRGSINAEGAIIVQGIEAKVKASAIFAQHHIPPAFFPLATIEEFGHNEQTGLFWMKQKTKSSTEFPHAELVAMYGTTVSGHIEKKRIRNLKGFKIKEMKGRELYLSVPYDEIFIDDDEIRLRSESHTTRNCMLISFSDHPPPQTSAPPAFNAVHDIDDSPLAYGAEPSSDSAAVTPLEEEEGEASGERQRESDGEGVEQEAPE